MRWAALFGGPIAGAILIAAYVMSRFGARGAPGDAAIVVHVIAVLLLLPAIPATVALHRRDVGRNPLIACWILGVLPCALWVLNSVFVVVQGP